MRRLTIVVSCTWLSYCYKTSLIGPILIFMILATFTLICFRIILPIQTWTRAKDLIRTSLNGTIIKLTYNFLASFSWFLCEFNWASTILASLASARIISFTFIVTRSFTTLAIAISHTCIFTTICLFLAHFIVKWTSFTKTSF